MRHATALLFALLPLGACASSHFETVVELAASKQPRQCTAPFRTQKLTEYGYRVDACEGTLYFRCFYRRKTMGRTQCCHLVPDEKTATAVLSAAGDDAADTCVDFVD